MTPVFEHEALLDDVLKVIDEADGATWKERAQRAAAFLKRATASGSRKAAEYWKRVYQNALARGKKADPAAKGKEPDAAPKDPAADDEGPELTFSKPDEDEKDAASGEPSAPEGEKPADDTKPGEGDSEKPASGDAPEGEKPAEGDGTTQKGSRKRRKRKKKGDASDDAPEAAGDDDASAEGEDSEEELPAEEQTDDPEAEGVDTEGLSEEEERLVKNGKHRGRLGEEAADDVEGQRKGFLSGVGDLLGGIAGAVGSVANWAAGTLTSLDAKTLSKAAGSLVFAALGGMAFGGVGALAGMALAQYFASKSAASRDESIQAVVQRALLLAEKKGTSKEDQQAWANHVFDSVKSGFEDLGKMDPKELAAVLKAANRFKGDLIPSKDA